VQLVELSPRPRQFPDKRQGVLGNKGVSIGRLRSLPFFLRCAMVLVLWLLLEINRISARPVLAEIDGRPTRIELERPDERPTRYIRPRR